MAHIVTAVKPYIKAAFAFAVAFLSPIAAALVADKPLTTAIWVSASLAGVIAAGGVYQIPYTPKS